jgi:hypothetical protein
MDRKGSDVATDGQFYLNGVDALTGGPLRDAQSVDRVVELAKAEFNDTSPSDREGLKTLSELKLTRNYGMDVTDLSDPAKARWGVILPEGENAFREALQPLIDLRAMQMGSAPKIFEVGPDTTATQFLRDNGVERGLGAVNNVPYYLAIIGAPQEISFRFQMELNTEYATGRLHFDSLDNYTTYAEHLVEYETGSSAPNRREAVFWAPERSIDPATSKSSPLLVQPLYDQLDPQLEFSKRLFRGEGELTGTDPATKESLRSILSGPRPPAFMFTASHGMGYKKPHPGQAEQQGALMCQEYVWNRKIDSRQWYGAKDLVCDGADLRGLVHFAFACFGAGTPQYDDYGQYDAPAAIIADQPFVAALPRAMLARGALAFVSHIDMAWGYSFMAAQPLAQADGLKPLEAFRRAVHRILAGDPIAHALRDQYDRGVHLSSSLLETIALLRRRAPVSRATIAQMWTERNDARAYLLVGDPAARLRVNILGQDTGLAGVIAASSASPLASSGAHSLPDACMPTPDAHAESDTSPATRPQVPETVPNRTTPSGRPSDGAAQADEPEIPVAIEERNTPFLPPPTAGGDKAVDKELLLTWKEYMKEGFQQNSKMFSSVLKAFMVPYWLTVAMYVAMFLFGLGTFVLAVVLAGRQKFDFAAIFGGLSAVSFLTFFISRPLRSLEQNVILITWLGVIYNTYWSQLMNATDPATIQQDLDTITKATVKDLRELATAQGKLDSQRPDLANPSAPQPEDSA